MAKLTDRTELTVAPSDSDLVHIVDVSDATDDPLGTSKKVTIANLIKSYVEALTSYFNVTTDDSDAITQGATNLFMTTSERTKLTGIEDGATADQTASEIKTAYESNADTNAYTDAEKAKMVNVPSDTSTALAAKEDAANKGIAGGYAELDATGTVPTAQLPSFVDDVLEYADLASFPATGSTGKIYVALDTNIVYRWSGSAYVEISASLALGETSSTAYRGDRGKIAYDHTLLTTGNPHNVTKGDVGLGNVDNTADVDKPVSTAQQAAIDAKIGNVVEDTTPQLGGNLDINKKVVGDATKKDNGNSGASFTIDWNNGQAQDLTLTANCTLTFTAPTGLNFARLSLRLIQDATGSRTVTFPSSVRWAGGTAPTLTTTANGVDIITFEWDGTNYDGVASLGFA